MSDADTRESLERLLESEPSFVKADLLPTGISYRCPTCGHQPFDAIEAREDAFGEFAVAAEDRFITCGQCGQLLDIGWAGWQWHDGEGKLSTLPQKDSGT